MIRTALLLVRDVLHFVALICSSHTILAAENLFLRTQLAFYVERKVRPRRLDDAPRIALVSLARVIDWHLSSPSCGPTRSSGGIVRDSGCSGGGSHGDVVAPEFLPTCRT